MQLITFNSFMRDLVLGNFNLGADTVKVMLLTTLPDKDADLKRSDLPATEASGSGYTAGGTTSTITVAATDTVNDDVEITLGAVEWGPATVSAVCAVFYKSRGGASSADELICYLDFEGTVASTGAAFSISASTLKLQN
jgi:hypothetical protein